MVQVVQANIAVHSSTAELPWSTHRFYMDIVFPVFCDEKEPGYMIRRVFIWGSNIL